MFDEIINRKNTNSIKYDFHKENNKTENLVPFWIADMDFKTAPAIINALKEKSDYGIFGYTGIKDDYYNALANWFKSYHNWHIEKDWLVITPGAVFAISAAINALTNKGDSVIINEPVYHPFSHMIEINNRKLIINNLILKNGYYKIDFEDFEKKIIENNVKLFILCNPHNPVGRVWTKEELSKLGDICLKHNVYIFSDELHHEFIYPGFKHTVFASCQEKYADISLICTSPSKTFNLAGLQLTNIFIKNKNIRDKFMHIIEQTGYDEPNLMGMIACQAGYSFGKEWLDEVNKYIYENLNFIRSFLKENIPKIKLIEPEASYVLWLDFREFNLDQSNLIEIIENSAGLWLDSGSKFGDSGKGFMRVNIACPKSLIKQAMEKLEKAFKNF